MTATSVPVARGAHVREAVVRRKSQMRRTAVGNRNGHRPHTATVTDPARRAA
ncbi:hypothetical protein PV779_53050 [Streptomyces sp. ID01-9D]|nr:hypothetical protein [Streptomyces sp. ID01-9D]